VLDHAGVADSVIIFANSFAGASSVVALHKYPNRFSSLILLDAILSDMPAGKVNLFEFSLPFLIEIYFKAIKIKKDKIKRNIKLVTEKYFSVFVFLYNIRSMDSSDYAFIIQFLVGCLCMDKIL